MPAEDPVAARRPWQPGEHESFLDAVRRHRRAAWRVTAASAAVDAVVALVVAVLMAPVFYAAIALAFDLANLVRPAANVAAIVMARLDPLVDRPQTVPFREWMTVGAWAAAPGLVWMASVLVIMRRAVRASAMFGGDVPARTPDAHVLAEARFVNVVEEMAVAANVPAPRVLVLDANVVNAAVFGPDEGRATIVGTSALVETLDREELQGVAGDLVGAVVNGDMTIGMRVAATLGLFGFVGCMAGAFTDGRGLRRILGRLAAATFWPTPASARAFLELVADPFAPSDDSTRDDGPSADAARRARRQKTSSESTWRALVWMPLAGPVCMTGFFGGLINLFLLQPLISLAWRQRKYMADATAVRLTRDPDTLAGALQKMAGSASGPVGAWAAHLCVVRPGVQGDGLFGASVVPGYPSIERRLRALGRMGAHVTPAARAPVPALVVLIGIPIALVLASLVGLALYMMAFLSIALSMLFLGIPLGVLHVALRALVH